MLYLLVSNLANFPACLTIEDDDDDDDDDDEYLTRKVNFLESQLLWSKIICASASYLMLRSSIRKEFLVGDSDAKRV